MTSRQMTSTGFYSAVCREEGSVGVRYMYVPDIGAMVAASPRDLLGIEKNRCPIEQAEYITAIAEVLFQQLTPEDQWEFIALCEELAAENDSRNRRC